MSLSWGSEALQPLIDHSTQTGASPVTSPAWALTSKMASKQVDPPYRVGALSPPALPCFTQGRAPRNKKMPNSVSDLQPGGWSLPLPNIVTGVDKVKYRGACKRKGENWHFAHLEEQSLCSICLGFRAAALCSSEPTACKHPGVNPPR